MEGELIRRLVRLRDKTKIASVFQLCKRFKKNSKTTSGIFLFIKENKKKSPAFQPEILIGKGFPVYFLQIPGDLNTAPGTILFVLRYQFICQLNRFFNRLISENSLLEFCQYLW